MRFFCADSTNIKIRIPCTLYICSEKTKDEPKNTKIQKSTKSAFY